VPFQPCIMLRLSNCTSQVVGKATNKVKRELGLGTTESVPTKPAVAVRTGYSKTRRPCRKSPASRPGFLALCDSAPLDLYLVEVPTKDAPYHRLELCKALCSQGQTGCCADHRILETFYLSQYADSRLRSRTRVFRMTPRGRVSQSARRM